MKTTRSLLLTTLIYVCTLPFSAGAIELLVNGSLESSVSPPNWALEQTVTDLPGAAVNASEQISFANEPEIEPGELGMFVRPFAGNQGTYADQNRKINFVLSQTVRAFAGRTYTFTGNSYFAGDLDETNNDGFSGGVETLHFDSPSGEVPSPTRTTFEIAFLNSSSAVIGSPVVLDLRSERVNDALWQLHTLSGLAPAGTSDVRVTVAARDMVENEGFQDAYFDNFRLTDNTQPTFNRLQNGDLNLVGEPNGYEITESPSQTDTISFRDFANHTPGGEQGLWLRAFEGTQELPATGIMSQTVPGVPGGNYTYSVFSKWETGYSGGLEGSITHTEIQMEFLNGANAVIGTPLKLDLRDAGQLTDGVWREYSLDGVAPVGTANVRISAAGIDMYDTSSNPQSAFFDDFSLELVPTLSCDLNGDAAVDAADAGVLFANWGTNNALADINDDNVVDAADAGICFGEWTGDVAPVAAVPEPTSLVIVGIFLLGAAASVRSGCRPAF